MAAVSMQLLGDRARVLHTRARNLPNLRRHSLDRRCKHWPIRGEQDVKLLDVGTVRLVDDEAPTKTLES